jgi:5'-nucleotidase
LLAEQFDLLRKESAHKLTILHTNDQHSRIEPFDASLKNPNQGGFAEEHR